MRWCAALPRAARRSLREQGRRRGVAGGLANRSLPSPCLADRYAPTLRSNPDRTIYSDAIIALSKWTHFARALVALLLCAYGVAPGVAFAQRADSSRVVDLREVGLHADTLMAERAQPFVLRARIRPETFRLIRLGGGDVPDARFVLDGEAGLLTLIPPLEPGDTLVARYRTWPDGLAGAVSRRRVEAADSAGAAPQRAVEVAQSAGDDDGPGLSKLQRSGSISRGVLAGNTRDATVESGLRLNLSGEIAEGIEVEAVLTDENTPILPEGNTQRVSEFDRVYIRLAARYGTARLGDFDLRLGESAFARFDRRLQGATVAARWADAPGRALGGGTVSIAGATSRGEFRTQQIQPIDGVQGPYRLEGAGGETFILVLPDSDVLYLDGERLVRGETNDYVIDYATAEITFTPARLITNDRRISAEFQYTTNQFTRTLLAADGTADLWQRDDGSSRVKIGATVLREADSRDFGAAFGISAADSALLVGSGDADALRSGAEVVPFDPEALFVQYRRTIEDFGGDGVVDTFFVAIEAAPPAGEPVFRVRFTRSGPGQGDYERGGRSVNGIVYEYVGRGRGAYLAQRRLPKPKEQRLVDFRAALEPVRGVRLLGEWAASLDDRNRFSDLDADDDDGRALEVGAEVVPRAFAGGTLRARTVHRRTDATFAPFARTRPVEFERRWNLAAPSTGEVVQDGVGPLSGRGDEVITEASAAWSKREAFRAGVEAGRLRLLGFEGTRWQLAAERLGGAGPRAETRVERVVSRDVARGEGGAWLRQRHALWVPLLQSRLTPRLEVEHEDRQQHALVSDGSGGFAQSDSLVAGALRFVEVRPGVRWSGGEASARGARQEASVTLALRSEDAPLEGVLRDAADALTLQANWTAELRRFRSDATLGFRRRRAKDAFRIAGRDQDTEALVLRWNGRASPLRRAVDVSWFYDAQTERTPTLQELYIRTGPELGEFVWSDDNGDGVIQIEEFIPERTPGEGTYVRTFVPSDTLTPTVSVQARLRIALDPAKLIDSSTPRRLRWLRQVSSRTTFDVLEKSRDDRTARLYLLDLSRFRDTTNTLDGRLRLSQDFTLFRRVQEVGLDLGWSQSRGLRELASGEEERFQNRWQAVGTWRPRERWSFRLDVRTERNRLVSSQLTTRRYDVRTLALEPEVAYSPMRALQLRAGLALADKRDALEGRTGRIIRVPLGATLAQAGRVSANARYEVAVVQVEGEASGLAAYELTEGRGAGTSHLWLFSLQASLTQYLRATLNYDGRKPDAGPTLHTVRMQLSAVF